MNAIDQLLETNNKLNYVNEILAAGNIEAWERKEYFELAEELKSKLIALSIYIELHKETFMSE